MSDIYVNEALGDLRNRIKRIEEQLNNTVSERSVTLSQESYRDIVNRVTQLEAALTTAQTRLERYIVLAAETETRMRQAVELLDGGNRLLPALKSEESN